MPAERPVPLSPSVSAAMSRMPRKNTQPEVALRSALHRSGLRFRTHLRLPGQPDIVFTRVRLAVFVDGCFWHSCPTHATKPKNNDEWWAKKLAANVARDARQTASLEAEGWTVERVWEHEVPQDAANRIAERYRNLDALLRGSKSGTS
jgi:DNA mismatch endonuclease (patch repair protein)